MSPVSPVHFSVFMSRLQEQEAKDPTIIERETQQSNDPTISSISQQQGERTSLKQEETFNRTRISIWMLLFLLLQQMEQLPITYLKN